ncbi:hypothetical protein [Paenibacillus sp. OAS669]|uniref:hypothetical protein n=1 Tax=Paenibacillus sp. OAS669 TaxID=2663821 RepID=UPI00178AD9E0|nr:hypothetical protein [Paenibacillus sp. OAS669]MBE1444240.1 hypothetical protein [Paenibacillus sp. OAS669]
MYYLGNSFIAAAVFFDSLLLRFNQQRNLHHIIRWFIHSVFNAIISLIIGVIISTFGLGILSTFAETENLLNGITLLMLPVFLFVCLTGIVLLNFRNVYFSLPDMLYVLYASIILSQLRRELLHAFIYFLSICMVLGIIIILVVGYMLVVKGHYLSDHTMVKIATYSFSAAFAITAFLYSYGTADELVRTYRQFILWLSVLGGVIIFSIYQININLSAFSTPSAVAIASIVFGFVLTMPTVADKGFKLFEVLYQYFSDPIDDLWNEYYQRFSIDTLLIVLIRKRDELLLEYTIIKFSWNLGDKWHYIRTTILGILFSGFMWWFLHNWIHFLTKILDLSWNKLVVWVSGDEKFAEHLIMICLGFTGLIYTIVSLARRYSNINWQQRYYSFGTVILAFTICSVLLSTYSPIPIFKYPLINTIILFLLPFWMSIGFIVEISYRIYRWIKN